MRSKTAYSWSQEPVLSSSQVTIPGAQVIPEEDEGNRHGDYSSHFPSDSGRAGSGRRGST